VGPKDAEGDDIGGNSMARLTVEYTVPIIERVRAAVFYDVGFVNLGSWNFGTSNYNADFGFGLRLNLPIGPIRLDYGIPTKSDKFNGSSSGRFQFSVGYQF
ncbi:MAG: BamA/TamA family outer membrane protein, partial [Verrucomicrobia bacterium]|nr:BamA/TamA family outer membrane protein [Verrucomicrobiota bacterium]